MAVQNSKRLSRLQEFILYAGLVAISGFIYSNYGEHPLATVLYFIGLIGGVSLIARMIISGLRKGDDKEHGIKRVASAGKYRTMTDTVQWRLFKVMYGAIAGLAVIVSINTDDSGLMFVIPLLVIGFFIIKRLAVYVVFGSRHKSKNTDMV